MFITPLGRKGRNSCEETEGLVLRVYSSDFDGYDVTLLTHASYFTGLIVRHTSKPDGVLANMQADASESAHRQPNAHIPATQDVFTLGT